MAPRVDPQQKGHPLADEEPRRQPRLDRVSGIIASIAGGSVDEAISLDMGALVERCARTNKKGKIKIEIEFTPMGANSEHMQVSASHSVSEPKGTPAAALLFIGPGGTLSKTDPYDNSLTLDHTTTKEP